MYIWQKQYSPPPDCSVCELLLHHVPVGGEDGESDDDDYHDFNSSDGDDHDDDDIYIMVKCMSVCMSVTFLLISFSCISGHFWV